MKNIEMKPAYFLSNTPAWLFWVICLFALFFACTAQAQEVSEGSIAFNEQRIQLNKQAMLVLGSWAAANMIVGGVWVGQSQGTRKHYHLKYYFSGFLEYIFRI